MYLLQYLANFSRQMVAGAGHTRSRCDLNTDPRMMEFFDSKLFPSHEKRSQRQLLESPKTISGYTVLDYGHRNIPDVASCHPLCRLLSIFCPFPCILKGG